METEDVKSLNSMLASGDPLTGLRIQDVDLGSCEAALLARDDLRGVVVLGGRVSPALAHHLVDAGAVVFPTTPDAPVDVYRSRLYTPEELYAGLDEGYPSTPDARAYAWSQDGTLEGDPYVAALRALHDTSVQDALDELVEGRQVVGIMGGHGVERGTTDFADAARLGRQMVTEGLVVATGGGPGAMEAANLGASAPDDGELAAALERVASVPGFRPSVADWARVALDARRSWQRDDVTSIGIPTWFYGHEPPNVFAQQIAKFFSNALREDLLLARCTAGVVVLPGAAGTVQEIFQLGTRLYYATAGRTIPLVLVDRRWWTEDLPAWPLLEALGRDREMGQGLHLVDHVEEVAPLLRRSSDAPLPRA